MSARDPFTYPTEKKNQAKHHSDLYLYGIYNQSLFNKYIRRCGMSANETTLHPNHNL